MTGIERVTRDKFLNGDGERGAYPALWVAIAIPSLVHQSVFFTIFHNNEISNFTISDQINLLSFFKYAKRHRFSFLKKKLANS